MSKIIIGIHGLGNKPPKKVLEKWWKKSIREGLKAHGLSSFFFKFKLVYWADVLHPAPLDLEIKNPKHPLYIKFPYLPATDHHPKIPSKIKQKLLEYLEKQLDKLFLNDDMTINFAAVNDLIIRRYFKDLDAYFASNYYDLRDRNRLARDSIRETLARVLHKYRRKEILLIAHSMGSIIAYDVLCQPNPDIHVNILVTIGSPLGLPVIISKIATEQKTRSKNGKKLCTPESVLEKWYNLSDLRDRVSLNYDLSDDYAKNSRRINPIDKVAYNNYKYKGDKNPHKSYGYLRTPEMAEIIHQFLDQGRTTAGKWLSHLLGRLAQRFWQV